MRKFIIALFAILSLTCAGYGRLVIGGVTVGTSDDDYLKYRRYIAVPTENQNTAIWAAGDDVTGKSPAEVEAIVAAIKLLETVPVCVEIFEKMKSANEDFSFVDAYSARRNVQQRLMAIAQMDAFNRLGIYTYCKGNSPAPGQSARAYWITGRKNRLALFRQISGRSSEAIEMMCDPVTETPTYGECMGALFACVWKGALFAMGTDDFDSQYRGRLDMDFEHSETPTLNTRDAQDLDTLVPGDTVYFKNHNYGLLLGSDDPDLKRPQHFFWEKKMLVPGYSYEASGENTIYIGDNKFEGLGQNFIKISETEIQDKLIDMYNNDLAFILFYARQNKGIVHVKYQGYEQYFKVEDLKDRKLITRGMIKRLIN